MLPPEALNLLNPSRERKMTQMRGNLEHPASELLLGGVINIPQGQIHAFGGYPPFRFGVPLIQHARLLLFEPSDNPNPSQNPGLPHL